MCVQDLFNDFNYRNLLPYDGGVYYYPNLLSPKEANTYFESFGSSIEWKNDEIRMFGKRIVTSRKVAWYADKPFTYVYSGVQKNAQPWTPELSALKQHIENSTGTAFNSCLLNLYHNGNESMGWHSDDEKMLDPNAPIASVSLGTNRMFHFKHKVSGEKVSMLLESGSLLLMNPPTQVYWVHALGKSVKVKDARINLTFRSVLPQPGI
jgi:alkylated DNA repair dioxygenase AlkB